MKKYQVTVSNVGQIIDTFDKTKALNTFQDYKNVSLRDMGRAGGEDVTLWEDGEPVKDYFGLNRPEEFVKVLVNKMVSDYVLRFQEPMDGDIVELTTEHLKEASGDI